MSRNEIPKLKWGGTRIVMPDDFPHEWHCQLSGRECESTNTNGTQRFAVAELLDVLPVAVLMSR
jgi:hypothetical protein